ncbi:MAG TPA: ATP-binding protein [Steroidobacteraceae bacterium]|nr:ATP-binding protein [Steroidobacteraceae bacterium]
MGATARTQTSLDAIQASDLDGNDLQQALANARIGQQRAEESLALRNAALDAASTYFAIVATLDPEHPIVYANRVFAAQHGFSDPAAVIGLGIGSLLARYSDSPQFAALNEALGSGESARVEMEGKREDGSTVWIGLSVVPIADAKGQIGHHVVLGANITARLEAQRKKAELQQRLVEEMRERERIAIELRLAQKLESVGRLAAGLAHEINTPIQYVADSVYFLKSAFEDLSKVFTAYREAAATQAKQAGDETVARLKALESTADYEFLSEEVPKAFERTLEGTDRVAGIVRAMKEFAHPDTNEHKPADINHALQTTLTVARSEYRYAAQIRTQFDELPEVLCNIGELNQVFLNLIVNSAHAIADTGKDSTTGLIAIKTTLHEDEVQISIADNGCGIPRENLDKIFDPFFTTKEVGRGTGQGLAIARSIVVDKHGGRIDVSSEPGRGTEFIISLPVQGRACKTAN